MAIRGLDRPEHREIRADSHGMIEFGAVVTRGAHYERAIQWPLGATHEICCRQMYAVKSQIAARHRRFH